MAYFLVAHRRDFHRYVTTKQRGLGMVEVIAGLFILLLILFASMDVFVLLLGATLNDSLVKDAARAASGGAPALLVAGKDRIVGETQAPYERAHAVLEERMADLHGPFEFDNAMGITETINKPIPLLPFGGPVNGTVTVETTVMVHPVFMLNLLRIKVVPLKSSQTFPYTWVMKQSTQ